MVNRNIRKTRYIVAALMTACIFLLGTMLGLIVEDKRIRMTQGYYDDQKLDYSSMQLHYEFMNQLSLEQDCDAMIDTFDQNLEYLESSRIRLENYLKDSKLNKDDFTRIKREYTISQIQYWLFNKKKKDICQSDEVSVLYFFAEDKACPDCNEQSFVLTYLKKLFGSDLLIFSFNTNFTEEPMIGLLERSMGVTEYPTMIIDDMEYSGLHDKEEILKVICPLYESEHTECVGYIGDLESGEEEQQDEEHDPESVLPQDSGDSGAENA